MDVLAPIRRSRERRALAAARRAADDELVSTRLPSPRLAWRIQELLDEDRRRELAQSIVDSLHQSDARLLPGASPLNRAGARSESDLLLRIAATVADCARRVQPRGLVLVERLLSDSASPLYSPERASRLHVELQRALDALEDVR
jgi:hypothetical protein